MLDVELEEVLGIITRDPTTSIRRISARLGVSKTSVSRILKKEGLHPYHFRRSHNLIFGDSAARLVFCMWLLREHRKTGFFETNFMDG